VCDEGIAEPIQRVCEQRVHGAAVGAAHPHARLLLGVAFLEAAVLYLGG
jgi:hypothetical protein